MCPLRVQVWGVALLCVGMLLDISGNRRLISLTKWFNDVAPHHIIMLSSLLLTFPKGCFNIIVYLYPSSCNIKWTWRKYLIIRVFLPKTDVNYLDWIYLFKDESNGLFLSDKYCSVVALSQFFKKNVSLKVQNLRWF